MAIPHHPDDHTSERDPTQRAYSSNVLPLVVLIVLLITIVATYYWYASA